MLKFTKYCYQHPKFVITAIILRKPGKMLCNCRLRWLQQITCLRLLDQNPIDKYCLLFLECIATVSKDVLAG